MIPLPIPLEPLVFVIALHFGLSAGWTFGRGLTLAGRHLPDWKRAITVLADEGVTEYVIALALITISTALMVSAPLESIVLVIIFGIGIGMAYDDQENNPPEGMVKHMILKFKGEADDISGLEE